MGFKLNVEFAQIDCGSCGGVYAITERHRAWCHDNSKSWTCPYCKTGWGFSGTPTRAEQLQKELDERTAELEWAEMERDQAEARRRAEKAAKTRLKNRVGHGVCPCCNRTFKQLANHMAKKHPDYVPEPQP